MKFIPSAKISYQPASHEDPGDPAVLKKVLLTHKDNISGSIQMVNWARLLPHKTFTRHAHPDMTEIFIMIDGEVVATVDAKTVILVKEDMLIVEPQEHHEMLNNSDTPAYFLAVGFVP